MKEMNQYQKALEEIVKSSCPVAMKVKNIVMSVLFIKVVIVLQKTT